MKSNLKSDLFKDYEISNEEKENLKGGATGATSIFSDTSWRETSDAIDVKSKWSRDSTSNDDDTTNPDSDG